MKHLIVCKTRRDYEKYLKDNNLNKNNYYYTTKYSPERHVGHKVSSVIFHSSISDDLPKMLDTTLLCLEGR